VSFLRKIQPYLWVATALAVLYSAWVFTARVSERKKLEERVNNQGVNPEFERLYGGDSVRILQFYAREGALKRGQTTLLCYGVTNATTVRMDPAIKGVYPSTARCLEVAPTRTTNYTLTAEGAKGQPVTGSVKVVVR
jgi:hypothetical protein